MKFYFCESCGKRLTEDQIREGDARDKKLRGVYCRECATGVTTMESLPMSNSEAQSVLSNAADRRPRGSASRRRSTSGAHVRPDGSARRTRDAPHSRRVAPPSRSSGTMVGLAVGGVLLLALAALLATVGLGSSEKPKKSATRSSRKPAPTETPSPKEEVVAPVYSTKAVKEVVEKVPLYPPPAEQKSDPPEEPASDQSVDAVPVEVTPVKESAPSPPLVVKEGLLAHWKFDEEKIGDPVLDASGNGRNGSHLKTLAAPHGPSADVPPVLFKNPRCLDFGPRATWVDFGKVKFLDGLTQLSVAFWFKKEGKTWKGCILSKDGSVECYVDKGDNRTYGFDISDQKFTFATPAPLGVWTHVVFTYEGTPTDTRRLYENGVLRETKLGNRKSIRRSSSKLLIGSRGRKYPYSGKIDEVRIYGRVLTQEEISSLARRKP